MKIGISKTWKEPNNIVSQCFGAEWTRTANIAFRGRIDVGGLND